MLPAAAALNTMFRISTFSHWNNSVNYRRSCVSYHHFVLCNSGSGHHKRCIPPFFSECLLFHWMIFGIPPHVTSPSPPIDSIWALVLVWWIRGKIIRTALCCVVYNSCAQRYTHTCTQFLYLCMLARFRFLFVYIFKFCLLWVLSCQLRSFCSCIACFCCVGFSFFST